jgi:hypothetical protein
MTIKKHNMGFFSRSKQQIDTSIIDREVKELQEFMSGIEWKALSVFKEEIKHKNSNCPKCASVNVIDKIIFLKKDGTINHCNTCGHEWGKSYLCEGHISYVSLKPKWRNIIHEAMLNNETVVASDIMPSNIMDYHAESVISALTIPMISKYGCAYDTLDADDVMYIRRIFKS